MGSGISNTLQGCTIEKTEHRGITIPQLRQVMQVITERCEKEKWRRISVDGRMEIELTPEIVNLYDINDRIIKAYTLEKKCSLVELLASEPQPPMWFVSHWWGNPVQNMIRCLEQHVNDRGLDLETTAYWVCAYANNQHSLGGEISTDPADSSFRKAMNISKGTISIVDSHCVVYSHIWCNYEAYIAIDNAAHNKDYLVDIYTCKEEIAAAEEDEDDYHLPPDDDDNDNDDAAPAGDDLAVGICDGFTEADVAKGGIDWADAYKHKRESSFPLSRILNASEFNCKLAQAARVEDGVHIRNAITGQIPLDMEPLADHPNYNHLNNILRGRFVVPGLSRLLKASLKITAEIDIQKYFDILKVSEMEIVHADLADRRRARSSLSSLTLFQLNICAISPCGT